MKAILTSPLLEAVIDSRGAELQSVRDRQGHEWVWPGTAPWPARSPLLFPIIGSPGGGVVRWQGRAYPMPSHGFLAQTELSAESSPSRADFTLSASEATRASFPFAFDYRIRYELDGARLTFAIAIGNPGDEPLPVQFGLHPGFVVPGRGEAPAVVVFEADEAVELRALRRGQRAFHMPSPLEGRRLQLDPGLFAEGGMLFDPVRSSWLWHGVPGRPGMRVSFAGFDQLALWSKPPGEFLCIEPWHGAPDSEDFTGSLAERAHVRMLPPGGRLEGRCDIEFGVPEPR